MREYKPRFKGGLKPYESIFRRIGKNTKRDQRIT